MTTGAFDPRLRVVECGQCGQGAPLSTGYEGGRVTCRACGATMDLAARDDRPLGAAPASPADEIARLTRLFVQLAHPIAANPYDLSTPAPGFTADPERDAVSADALRSAWNAARKTLPMASVTKQRDGLWIALHLVNVQLAAGNVQGARALLETALDLIGDPGLQHLIRCRLSALALWDGAPEAAAYWLASCDPAPEVVQLDATYREAQARLASSAGRPLDVLEWVGSAPGSVAVPPAWERAFDALRIGALGAAGQGDAAFAELERALKLHGETLLTLDLGADDPSVRRFQQEALARLSASRDAIPVGAGVVFAELARLPMLALGVLVLVTLPRCFFDADPFGGAHGYALCPSVCATCEGPFRVHTEWQHRGNSHSTSGSDYYCATPTNEVFALSDAELTRERAQLRPYKLSWAPGALTYATLVVLLLPVSALTGLREHVLNRRRRERLQPEIERLARAAGTTSPPPREHGGAARAELVRDTRDTGAGGLGARGGRRALATSTRVLTIRGATATSSRFFRGFCRGGSRCAGGRHHVGGRTRRRGRRGGRLVVTPELEDRENDERGEHDRGEPENPRAIRDRGMPLPFVVIGHDDFRYQGSEAVSKEAPQTALGHGKVEISCPSTTCSVASAPCS